jgi:phospholipid/cholesterol/gamma-HCH transport system permease protein
VIVMIATYQGFNTRGGAAGVGKSTTFAVVTAIILIFVFNFMLSYVFYGIG